MKLAIYFALLSTAYGCANDGECAGGEYCDLMLETPACAAQ